MPNEPQKQYGNFSTKSVSLKTQTYDQMSFSNAISSNLSQRSNILSCHMRSTFQFK